MKYIKLRVQDQYLLREGLRGRWVTAYFHRYGAQEEASGRSHSHPFKYSFGIVLMGKMLEKLEHEEDYRDRRPFSISFYTRKTRHRVIFPQHAVTIFIGLGRTQIPIEQAAEVAVPEGYAHYSEVEEASDGITPKHHATYVHKVG